MAASKIPPNTRARLRLGEDPYAFVEFEEEYLAESSPRRQPLAGADLKASRHQDRQHDLFAAPTPPLAYNPLAVPSGNPYARIAQSCEDDENAGQTQADAKSRSLSKLEFRRRCASLFRQYIPDLEGGSLRRYMRDFIARNEPRSARIRYRLVQGLSKFDLSDLTSATPLFNREDESLSEQKLRDIERRALEDE